MGLLTCCSRRSVSSDILQPRQAATLASPYPPTPPPHLHLDPASSWGVASGISQFSKPEDAIMLHVMFDTDDRSEIESVHEMSPKKNNHALDAVKTKLKKHLSRDGSSVSKRASRSTVGTSEEEIGRRAELKRLRHQRIQEELSNDEIYDEDAKSVMTTRTLSATQSPLSGPALSSSSDRADSASPFPEYTVLSIEHAKRVFIHSRQHSEINVRALTKDRVETWVEPPTSNTSLRRRHSSTDLHQLLRADTKLSNWLEGKRGSILFMPPAPHLEPQRLSSIADSAVRRTSWRLSFSGQSLTRLHTQSLEHHGIGMLIHDSPSASMFNAVELKWLHSQGFRSASPNSSDKDAPDDALTNDLHAELCSTQKGLGGVDGSKEDCVVNHPACQHLTGMHIPRRPAVSMLSTTKSLPQLSILGGRRTVRKRSTSGYESQYSNEQQIRRMSCSVSEYSDISKHVAGTSGGNQNPADARLDGQLESATFEIIRHSPVPMVDKVRATASAPLYQVLNTGSRSVSPPVVILSDVNGSTITLDTPEQDATMGSAHSSDTSFQRREEKLEDVRKRFPYLSRAQKRDAIKSRFAEAFEESKPKLPPRDSSRLSFLSSIHIPRIRKPSSHNYDGSEGDDKSFLSPSRNVSSIRRPHVLSRTSFPEGVSHPSPGLNEQYISAGEASTVPLTSRGNSSKHHVSERHAEDVWTQAIKDVNRERVEEASLTVQKRDSYGRHSSVIMGHRISSWKGKGKQIAAIAQAVSGDGHGIQPSSAEHVSPASDPEFTKRTPQVDFLTWSVYDMDESHGTGPSVPSGQCVARNHTDPTLSKSKPISIIPPKSWARFPSHDRDIRNASAGCRDSVDAHDFAAKKVDAEGNVEWYTAEERKHLFKHHNQEGELTYFAPAHHSLPVRMGKKIRASLQRFLAAEETFTNDQVRGRRSSMSAGGIVDYPELELLAIPGEDDIGHDLLDLQVDVEAQLRIEERERRRMIVSEDGIVGVQLPTPKVFGLDLSRLRDGSADAKEGDPHNFVLSVKQKDWLSVPAMSSEISLGFIGPITTYPEDNIATGFSQTVGNPGVKLMISNRSSSVSNVASKKAKFEALIGVTRGSISQPDVIDDDAISELRTSTGERMDDAMVLKRWSLLKVFDE